MAQDKGHITGIVTNRPMPLPVATTNSYGHGTWYIDLGLPHSWHTRKAYPFVQVRFGPELTVAALGSAQYPIAHCDHIHGPTKQLPAVYMASQREPNTFKQTHCASFVHTLPLCTRLPPTYTVSLLGNVHAFSTILPMLDTAVVLHFCSLKDGTCPLHYSRCLLLLHGFLEECHPCPTQPPVSRPSSMLHPGELH